MKTIINDNFEKYGNAELALTEGQNNLTALKNKQKDIENRIKVSETDLGEMKLKKAKALKDCALNNITESALAKVRSAVAAVEMELSDLTEMKVAVDNAIDSPAIPMPELTNAVYNARLATWGSIDAHLQTNPPKGLEYLKRLRACQVQSTSQSGHMLVPYIGRVELSESIPGVEHGLELDRVKNNLEKEFFK